MNFSEKFKYLKGIEQLYKTDKAIKELNQNLKQFQGYHQQKQPINISTYICNQQKNQQQFLEKSHDLIQQFKITKHQLKQLFHDESKQNPVNSQLYRQKNAEIENKIISYKIQHNYYHIPLKNKRITPQLQLPQFKRFKIKEDKFAGKITNNYLTNVLNEKFDGIRSTRQPNLQAKHQIDDNLTFRSTKSKTTKNPKYQAELMEKSQIRQIFKCSQKPQPKMQKKNLLLNLDNDIENPTEKSKSLYIPIQSFGSPHYYTTNKPNEQYLTKIQKMKSYTTYFENDKNKNRRNRFQDEINSHCKTDIFINQQRKKICSQRQSVNSIDKQLKKTLYNHNPQYLNGQQQFNFSTNQRVARLLKQLINYYTKAQMIKFCFIESKQKIVSVLLNFKKALIGAKYLQRTDLKILLKSIMCNRSKNNIEFVTELLMGNELSIETTKLAKNQNFKCVLTEKNFNKLKEEYKIRTKQQSLQTIFEIWCQIRFTRNQLRQCFVNQTEKLKLFIQNISSSHEINATQIQKYIYSSVQQKMTRLQIQIFMYKCLGKYPDKMNFLRWLNCQSI